MEPTTTHSVHRAPAWNQGGSNAAASPGDPLAFFDLIMSTARTMSSQGGDRNDPLATTGPVDPRNPEPGSSHSGSSPWQDDRHHNPGAGQGGSASASTTAEPERAPEENDPAAVVEFSERPSTQEDERPLPDDAALATAGAAGQQTQLLGAPDPLQSAEEAGAIDAEIDPADARPTRPVATERALDEAAQQETDAPLDTSATTAEEHADDRQAVADLDAQMTAAAKRDKADEKADAAAQQGVADETNDESEMDASSEVTSDRDRPASNEELEAKREASKAENESPSGDTQQRESNQEGERAASTVRNKSDKPKPTIAESAQANAKAAEPAPETATTKVTNESIAPVAAASMASQPTSDAGRSASSNEAGTTGITSLLQRGLQRGTLQKSTEGKPTAGLDTKQQVRLVNRVARAVETTPPGQAIRIRLNPSELGALKVEIKIENGNLTARIEAENPATRQVLLENLPQLKERLAESNIQVQQFDVDLMGQESPSDRETSHLGDEAHQREDGRSSGDKSRGRSADDEGDREGAPRRQVNKEAEQESRNLNITV